MPVRATRVRSFVMPQGVPCRHLEGSAAGQEIAITRMNKSNLLLHYA